ncbi:hypothetical protein HGRIS_010694 [Hohenbuehelia grisea]|uniref:NmrA-like domain-containing protein n=1 Tax=Hohenbuehelia grisea TaxID=104357 RepID=A0ABR3IY79_9AGAR
MAILLTGGTGKTGKPISQLLHKAGHSVYVASRSGTAPEPLKGVKFDWNDAKTHEAPFTAASAANESITAVYIICPHIMGDPKDVIKIVQPFIDLAVTKGVKRFVLMSASGAPKGSTGQGLVHEYLEKIGVDYCSLRPTLFMENFVENFPGVPIRTENAVRSAAGDARMPFVAVEDIAEAAVEALTTEKIVHRDLLVGGPELLNFQEVAAIFTEVLGREILYKKFTADEYTKFLAGMGLPEGLAKFLVAMDVAFSTGVEERRFQAENKHTGHVTLKAFVQAHRQAWNAGA